MCAIETTQNVIGKCVIQSHHNLKLTPPPSKKELKLRGTRGRRGLGEREKVAGGRDGGRG